MNREGRSDFHRESPLPWDEYLTLLAQSSQENYLGLLLPLYRRCDPCHVQYDAVIKMETFQQDLGFD